MKTKNNFKKELPILIIVFLPILFIVLTNNQLSNITEINWIQPKQISVWTMLSIILGVNFFIYGLLLFIQKIDPRKKNYEIFKSSFYKIRFVVSLFMTMVISIFIAKNIGFAINERKVILICTYCLFAIGGNYIHSVKQNWFIGFRTPWALENETVWRKTNQFGSKIMVFVGILGLVLTFIPLDDLVEMMIFIIITLIIIFIPIIYSYKVYKGLEIK